jgi:anaerobic selenocysteine-containing dehydrogenase
MHLLMGKIGRPGSAPMQLTGQPSGMNVRETGVSGSWPGFRRGNDLEAMRELAGLWNLPVETLGIRPATALEMFQACRDGQLKVLWNIGTNPATSLPDRTMALQALKDTFLVVQEPFVDAETAQFADILLPPAMWGEKTGCMTNAERRCTLLERAVMPPGEARSDLDILVDFARRMDLRDRDGDALLAFTTPEGAFDEWREVSRGRPCDYSGMSYSKLRASGGLQWPCSAAHPDGTPRLYTEPAFATTPGAAERSGHDLHTGLEHISRDHRRARQRGRARLIAADYQPPFECRDAEFPLIALTGRQVYQWQTRTRTARSPVLQAAAPDLFIGLHAEDARRLELEDGDLVRVVSRRASLVGPARVNDVLEPGTVFIPFHYGTLHGDHAANSLMLEVWDPVSGQPMQKYAAVRIEKIGKGQNDAWWNRALEAPMNREAP